MQTKNTLNRREFIGMTVVGSAAFLTESCQSSVLDQTTINPQKVRTRYNIADPDEAAKRNVEYFKKAVKEMKEISKKDPESKMGWFAQAYIHYQYCRNGINDVHGKPIFLPWHRAYLVYFEEICRKILCDLQVSHSDDFALPYWDWSKSPYIPEVFWNEDKNDWDDELNSIKPPDSWKLTNKWERNEIWNTKCEDVDQSTVDDLMTKDFHGLIGGITITGFYHRGELEGSVHNRMHGFIGGNMFNSPEAAALDPIFWLHHANVDRLWNKWMKIHEKETPPPKCPTSDSDCCNNCAAISKEKDKQKCFEQSAQICKWLGTEITGFPLAIGNIDKIRVCNLLNTLNLGYKYSGSEEIHFGDCINIRTINEDDHLIGAKFYNKNLANINSPVTIRTEELLTSPKNQQNLQNMQTSLSQIFTTKITSDSPSTSPSLLLTLEIEKPENPATSVRVFIGNTPINLSELSVNSPSYVATISFFESIGRTHHHDNEDMNEGNESRRFIFDVTSAILKLESFDLASAEVAIFPKFLNGKPDDSTGEIRLLSLQFLLAQ